MRTDSRRLVWAIVLLVLQMVSGCGQAPQQAAPLPEVTVSNPMQREVTTYLEYTGTTAAVELADIKARIPGFLEKINFEPRSKVKAGGSASA